MGPAVWEVVAPEGLQGTGLRALEHSESLSLVGRSLASCHAGLGRTRLVHRRNSGLRPTAEGRAAWASRFLLLLSLCLLTQPAASAARPARALGRTPRKAEAQRPVVVPEGGGLPLSSSRSQDCCPPPLPQMGCRAHTANGSTSAPGVSLMTFVTRRVYKGSSQVWCPWSQDEIRGLATSTQSLGPQRFPSGVQDPLLKGNFDLSPQPSP